MTGPGGLTRVLALVVNTGDQRPAVVIHSTLNLNWCYWSDTGHEAIAPGSGVTGALRLMVGGCTGCVLGTGAGQTDRATGLTEEVTGLVLPAVVVRPTLHIDAGHQGVALQSLATHTLRLVELNQTFSPATTRSGGVQTRVETVLVDASFVDGTVGVSATLRSVALCVRVPSVPLRAGAHWVVGPGDALRLGRARVVNKARVYAVLIDAGLALRTVWVLRTLRPGLD